MKRKTTALIDQVFPEYEQLFSNNFMASSVELLLKYPTPDKIVKANTATLTSLLLKHSSGHFGKGKALETKALEVWHNSVFYRKSKMQNGKAVKIPLCKRCLVADAVSE